MGLSGDDPTQTMCALDAEAATPSSAGRKTSASTPRGAYPYIVRPGDTRLHRCSLGFACLRSDADWRAGGGHVLAFCPPYLNPPSIIKTVGHGWVNVHGRLPVTLGTKIQDQRRSLLRTDRRRSWPRSHLYAARDHLRRFSRTTPDQPRAGTCPSHTHYTRVVVSIWRVGINGGPAGILTL